MSSLSLKSAHIYTHAHACTHEHPACRLQALGSRSSSCDDEQPHECKHMHTRTRTHTSAYTYIGDIARGAQHASTHTHASCDTCAKKCAKKKQTHAMYLCLCAHVQLHVADVERLSGDLEQEKEKAAGGELKQLQHLVDDLCMK
jgi:hypothetical protein